MKPTRQQQKQAVRDTEPYRKLNAARVPDAEAKKEIRKTGARVTEHADGKGYDVHDPRPGHPGIMRLYEMQAEHRKLQYEIGQNLVENQYPVNERVALKHADGRIASLPPGQAESAVRKGRARELKRVGKPQHRTVVDGLGVHFVYEAEPGGELEFVRAYRLQPGPHGLPLEVPVEVH